MSPVATIRAADLPLLLAAARLRRHTQGRTCQLCALSQAPMITLTCRDRLRFSAGHAERARAYGLSPVRVSPMQRGDIGRVIEQTRQLHGRPEVTRTWGMGIRALQAEPRHVLNGGAA